ncbi:hypothetical protein [Novosphingobium aerophilum]|uniref:YD repeat-containing protein n=1 Tax=Novosphingobium aerophilum TaxID=2839843 RepID=A0A7X1FAL7_9SPHN|nr:hypothetical protein [Novosphingobium aerophilum]MBC2653214.1 hypothetical protein [Novosphingobium aerophilum]
MLATPLHAQAVGSPFTTHTRYDALGRVTGTIAADPDGAGALPAPATRNTYDAAGNLTRVETGAITTLPASTVAPSAWTGFTVEVTTDYTYDVMGRRLTQRVRGSDGVTVSLQQFSYDSLGRQLCSVVRMNPGTFAASQPDACTLGPAGAAGTANAKGPDRIIRTVYDAAGRVLQVRKGVGTADEVADVQNDPVNLVDYDGQEAGCVTLNTGCGVSESAGSWESFKGFVSTVVDFIPGIGDIKGGVEAARNPTPGSVFGAIAGLAPGLGDAAGKVIKNADRMADVAAKGLRGEAATAARLGTGVTGRRVTLEASNGRRSVVDFTTRNRGVVESKNGPGARLSPGQRAVRDDIRAGRPVIPRGQNAKDAGLQPGVPTKMKCHITHRTNC